MVIQSKIKIDDFIIEIAINYVKNFLKVYKVSEIGEDEMFLFFM